MHWRRRINRNTVVLTDTEMHADLIRGHLDGRSRKASLDKSQGDRTDEQAGEHASITNGAVKAPRKSSEPQQNGIHNDEPSVEKKRGRKSKAERVEPETKKHRSKSIVGSPSLIHRSILRGFSRRHRKVRRDRAVPLSPDRRLPRPNARVLASQHP